MPTSTFTYESRDGLTITAYRWDTTASVRGVVQLTHGMGEHALRYDPLANALTSAGFVVYAQDHRGHGATARSDAELGQLGADGWGELVNDIGLLSARARNEHDDVPLVLLGHSMGSFAAQQFALDRAREIDALALTGTAAIDLLESAIDLDAPIDLAMFNAPFAPARTDYDWLSRDEEQVDRYVADPHCGFGIDGEAGKAMFAGARPLAEPTRIAAIRSDLPVYIAVGDQDPVNGQLALVSALIERYSAHLADVTVHIYPEARHEIFNETNRAEVFADLLTWLDRIVPA